MADTTTARLVVIQGPDKGRTFEAGAPGVQIGRSTGEIDINDNTVSRLHARVYAENGTWILRDLDSANGTYINGVKISRPLPLKQGDQIRIGSTLLVFGGTEVSAGITVRPDGRNEDLVSLDSGKLVDSAILAALPSNEDSVIMASPESAEAMGNLRVLYQLTSAIGSIFDTEQLLERVVDLIFDKVRFERGFVLMREDLGHNGASDKDHSDTSIGRLTPKVIRYAHANAANKITISRTIVNHVLRRREGVLCSNAMTDQRFTKGKSVHNYGIRSAICVPIQARDRILGVIHIDSAVATGTYSPDQLRLMTAIGYQTGLAIENAMLYQAGVRAERLAAVGETVATLSHAIKNILQGLRSGADVVEAALKSGALTKARTGWPIVERNLERIYQLVMNMLAYSKQREPRTEPVNLNHIIREVLELIEPQADEKGVMVVTDLDSLPAMPLDAEGVHQVVLNLLTNALDAVSAPNGTIQVQTRYDSMVREARVVVEDNGVGIKPDRMESLFEPFESTKGQSGTGLGLAVARKIVQEHHGRIEVRSTPGEGTAFTIIFSGLPATGREEMERTHGPASPRR
ncbi:MAG: Adaptive-response sensory-kinase SasA [Phycisphaerae bacterium]|nr:Adaptive-response sensory-kinase SasA [Phycisphaerae bacterium]